MNPVLRPSALAALLAVAFAAPVAAQDLGAVPAGTYKSDPTHAYVDFSYNHLGLSNPSLSFDQFEVTMELDPADVGAASIQMTIDPASVVAGSDIWKEHLTSADWFDVAQYPDITFASTSVQGAGDGAYTVNGDLTIKGESVPVSMNVTINAAMNHPMSGDPVIGLNASGEVLRSEFGLGKAAPAVSDEVQIELSVEMVLQK